MHDRLPLRAVRQEGRLQPAVPPFAERIWPVSQEVVAARESWLKDARNRRVAVDFLRALNEGQQLARENAAAAKRALRRFTRVDDDAYLQGSFEYYRDAFPPSLRVIERAMANALKFIDHPKARQFDVRQSFDNSFIDEAMR